MTTRILLCDCLGSQTCDLKAIAGATECEVDRVRTALCQGEAEVARRAIAAGGTVIACGQERARFEAMAAESGAPAPLCVDIRDRAGWTDGGDPGPKQAALVADALRPTPPTRTLDVESHGLCLVLGSGSVAVDAALRLADALSVTVLLGEAGEATEDPRIDVALGRVRRATGAFGAFAVEIDGLAERIPGGRGAPQFAAPRDGARASCDIILDLTGGAPLFPAHHKRDGYLRPDPGDPAAVARAVFDASHLTGTFEKPLHVRLETSLCAHSRAAQTGCTRCLDVCPTGAITADGDHVAVDPMVCAGCGACSALCPSGAIALNAPAPQTIFGRLSTLAAAFRRAGGAEPRLLVHDAHGAEMIALLARYGAGLPADVIPLELPTVSGFGHAEMLAALGCGFSDAGVLLSPGSDRATLTRERDLTDAIAGPGGVRLFDVDDPDRLGEEARVAAPGRAVSEPILPMGARRQVARLAAKALRPDAGAPLRLPDGAPYGAVIVDTGACTLCLSCTSLCPSGALVSNPDRPQVRFQEDACLQCGLCANVCPEDAITYEARLDLSDAALEARVLHEEEPYECVECGKPFGVRSTVERIVEKLAGKHAMFGTEDAARAIRMCDDCRVRAQFGAKAPMALGERPRPRVSSDYMNGREDQ